jgi:hypothetical protein
MIKLLGMYKYGDNDRKFVSCYLKSDEYTCYVRNVIRSNCWMLWFVDVNPNSNLLCHFRKLEL